MIKDFRVIRCTYHNSPLEIREALTMDETSSKLLMNQLKEVLALEDLMVLSTCNRTEVYFSSPKDLSHEVSTLLCVHKGVNLSAMKDYLETLSGRPAVEHLFKVAVGMESQVLGEHQITNQVKKAYQWSADENVAGPFLHRLLHTIFFTNKRIDQETGFRDGNASTSSLAVDLTKSFVSRFQDPIILLVGLGEIGRVVAENLKEVEARVVLVNRTEATSIKIAEEYNFEYQSFEQLSKWIKEANVVISTVQVAKPIIGKELLVGIVDPKMFIDLSMPRSIDHQIEDFSSILLYNLDQLSKRAEGVISRREAYTAQVNEIIASSLSELSNWSQEMEVSPTIKRLKLALEDIRQQEISRYVNNLSEEEAMRLDEVTKNMIQKVIKLPVLQLKAACKRGEAETLIEVLNDLFNLEQELSK